MKKSSPTDKSKTNTPNNFWKEMPKEKFEAQQKKIEEYNRKYDSSLDPSEVSLTGADLLKIAKKSPPSPEGTKK